MKLAHITPCFAPATAYGGPIESITGLCRALAERHHEVRVLTTDADGGKTLNIGSERFRNRFCSSSASPLCPSVDAGVDLS